MKLIPESSRPHKLWSVRLWTAAVTLAALEPMLPDWEGVLPEWAHGALVVIVGIAGLVARFVQQPEIHDA